MHRVSDVCTGKVPVPSPGPRDEGDGRVSARVSARVRRRQTSLKSGRTETQPKVPTGSGPEMGSSPPSDHPPVRPSPETPSNHGRIHRSTRILFPHWDRPCSPSISETCFRISYLLDFKYSVSSPTLPLVAPTSRLVLVPRTRPSQSTTLILVEVCTAQYTAFRFRRPPALTQRPPSQSVSL